MRTTALFNILTFCSAAFARQQIVKEDYLSTYQCLDHPYKIHIFSKDPLVIYIPNFIAPLEAVHLEKISKDSFTRSGIVDDSGTQRNASTRTSSSTNLADRDAIIRCIENRALSFQGLNIPRTHLEPLQLVRYSESEYYHTHTDWFTSPSQTTRELGGNRVSSFFVYVAARNTIGGGTNFPLLDAPEGEEWCDYVNCDEEWEMGVTFRPVEGSAVYWENMVKVNDGTEKGVLRGDPRVLHAGLPVQGGMKLGMNIWTREGPLDEMYRGED